MSPIPTDADTKIAVLEHNEEVLKANNRALSTANRHLRTQVANLRDIIEELHRQRGVWQARAAHEEQVRDRARSIAGGT